MSARPLRVALLGAGNVGTEVARLLAETSEDLTARVGAPLELVGVAVRDDVKNLRARAPFDDRAFIDVSDHTKKAGLVNTGLQALAAHFLGLQMKKSKKVQTSNWAKPLDERQIHYAANDAWFSRELYLKLEKDGLIPRFG